MKNIKKQFAENFVFYTPKEDAEKLKKYIDIEFDEVYDPTCGQGNLLAVFDDNLKKYGFTYLIIPLFPLLLLLGLISAARADMVFSLLFLVIPYVVTENKRDKKVGALQVLKKIIPIAIMAVLILVAILLFTGKRSGSIEHD